MTNWTISVEQAKKIIEADPVEIKESKIFNDLYLTKEERIKNAKEILDKWKNK